MSSQSNGRRMTTTKIRARKGGTPVVCLTAYTAPMARVLDPHVDILLVGDSLAMVVHGMETTIGISLDHMIMHAQAVMRGSRQALVVVDMPFGTYEESKTVAYRNAARVLRETGCAAVKLEGGKRMAETIAFLVDRGIPVMGHIGLLPQSVHAKGGYKIVGRERSEWPSVIEDAVAVSDAGAFCIVIEGVSAPLATLLTQEVSVPTIGIGASNQCDGQILVTEDMLGLTAQIPSFVKSYAELGDEISTAVQAYAGDVRDRRFPGPEHVYGMSQGPRLVANK